MEILSFKVKGKMAHFRKYYANNTAFSFTIPPRTALMGMVAGVMGWPKDSYYEKLGSHNIQFAIRVLSPLKKSFHRLNLLSIKSLGDLSKKWSSDFRGEGGRIQTPFEIVSGWNLGENDVEYQILLTSSSNGSAVFEEIKDQFLNNNPVYNLTLGTANFSASLSEIKIFEDSQVKEINSDEYVLIHSAIPVEYVEDLKFDKEEYGNYNFVEEDMMPGDFVANGNREVKRMNKLLFSTTQNPLRVKIKNSYYQIMNGDDTINFQFMDV